MRSGTFAGKPCVNGHAGLRHKSTRRCVECHRAAEARRRVENGDRVRAQESARYARGPEKERARSAAWAKANAEKVRASQAARYRADREKRRAYGAARYAAKREEVLARCAVWRRANPEACAASKARKRARRRNAPGRGVSSAEWRNVLAESLGICAYCNERKALTMDHIDPLNRGGAHDVENIAAACSSCNSSKHDTPLLLWLAKRALLR